MKKLIIYAHPHDTSLNASLRDVALEVMEEKECEYELIDLYREKFNPLLDVELKERTLLPDVVRYQEMIAQADQIVIISPTWWYGEPAILKGFFDRVLTSRFAFRYGMFLGFSYPIRLLKGKKVLWVKTMNSPWWWYWFGMGNWMVRNIRRGALGFCGMKVNTHLIYAIVFKKRERIEKDIARFKVRLRSWLS